MTTVAIRNSASTVAQSSLFNPLWTVAYLGAARLFGLDSDAGYTLDNAGKLATWTDQARGRVMTPNGNGTGATHDYPFGSHTAMRFRATGYQSDQPLDTAEDHRFWCMVVDAIDIGDGKCLFNAVNLSCYTAGGNTLRLGTPTSFISLRITPGKHVVTLQRIAGSYVARLDGTQGPSDPIANVAPMTVGTMELGFYDPGVPDVAIRRFEVGSGERTLAQSQVLEAAVMWENGLQAQLPPAHPYVAKAPRLVDAL